MRTMDNSMPGFHVHHYLLEFAETHVCQVSYSTKHLILYHPILLLPSIFQLQGLIQWIIPSYQVTKTLEFQLQHQSFQSICRIDLLYNWLVWSCGPRDSQQSSETPKFKSIISLALSLLTSVHDYWKNHSFDNVDLYWQSNVSAF